MIFPVTRIGVPTYINCEDHTCVECLTILSGSVHYSTLDEKGPKAQTTFCPFLLFIFTERQNDD